MTKAQKKLAKLTEEPGAKSEFAMFFGCHPARLTDWIGGRCKPNADARADLEEFTRKSCAITIKASDWRES